MLHCAYLQFEKGTVFEKTNKAILDTQLRIMSQKMTDSHARSPGGQTTSAILENKRHWNKYSCYMKATSFQFAFVLVFPQY